MADHTDKPRPGQRWFNDNEPELGLGIVLETEYGRVTLLFPGAEERRIYALESAPLRRVRFAEGDQVSFADGSSGTVSAVRDEGGLLVYVTEAGEFSESQLADTIDLAGPWDRLLSGRTDAVETFALRREALEWRQKIRGSSVRGFVGARVDLIPHQMSIVSEVTARLLPRVLLADEVGLGKTIEACLILHRLHLTGRANRVLILLPEPLIHQWFVELLRRFNLLFAIFDEERCASLEAEDPETNPFLDSQLVLASVGLLANAPRRAAQAIAGEWDLVIVDEAHHLEWSEEAPSPAYQVVEQIAQRTPGLLLLTATPEQLGPEGHFARLKLIDPDRYDSLSAFQEESRHYAQVARAVDRLVSGKSLTPADRKAFGSRSPRIRELSRGLARGGAEVREQLVAALVDEFGIGRSLFRNRRANLSGFPKRELHAEELPTGDAQEKALNWLAALLRKLPDAKFLLICRSLEQAEWIQERLKGKLTVKSALFHEGLSLLNRDRNAAFFAEEEGARILVCSEIGSEGRNFQFAHHLVLFDLPANPDLLEQRIGRLDRIGQTETIRIHVPFQRKTRSDVLLRWYHEGLNAFEHTCKGAALIAHEVRTELAAAIEEPEAQRIDSLVEATRRVAAEISRKLEEGADRLLDFNSFNPEQAASVIARIEALDRDDTFETFFIRLLDECGLYVEELARRRWLFRTGHLRSDAFPGLPEEGLSATFDRSVALSREEIDFLTIDHPLVRGGLDVFLGTESGNAVFAEWHAPGKQTLYLEVLSSIECLAPGELHADRFLAPVPIRVVMDHRLQDCSDDPELARAKLATADPRPLLEREQIKRELLPAMLDAAEKQAATVTRKTCENALAAMEHQLQAELDRLADLKAADHPIRPEETTSLERQRQELRKAIAAARPRIEALRLILRKE